MGDKKNIKCVVWDLDNTIWDGILLEDSNITIKKGITDIIDTLDKRGILQSISSRNDYDKAMSKLEELGIKEYFIYPQINWNSKSESIKNIAKLINIGVNTIAFIDDQVFERDEVKFNIPEIMCIDSADVRKILDMPKMNPRFITEDSKNRRFMYMSDIERNKAEEVFAGTKEEFLASLGMKFTISNVNESDLQRAEELTVRTNQLNATGYTYSYEDLNQFRKSDNHKLFITDLSDKYGDYGKIGLSLIECTDSTWTIKLLLMSCRVMSRGVGTIMLNHIMRLAKEKKKKLLAEFVPTDRNRMMYITYKFAGFKEINESNGVTFLENDLTNIQDVPDYIGLRCL